MSVEISLIMLFFAVVLFPILFCLVSDRYFLRGQNELRKAKPEQVDVSAAGGFVAQVKMERSTLQPQRKMSSAYAAHQYAEQHGILHDC